MLAAPINPSDINMIEGVYKILPPVPAVPGNEGVGVVIETGSEVKKFKKNDWVLPALPGFGTWRTHTIGAESSYDKIDNTIPMELAATIAVNPCAAYRMLKDFVKLKSSDTIIQNGSNSGVGLAVIQLAKAWGFKTINIIRDRPNIDELIQKLKKLGGDVVITEETLNQKDKISKLLTDANIQSSTIRLGLNCVGGKLAGDMTRLITDHGTLVTYGGMSKRPLMIPTAPLIFKNISFVGFWLSQWTKDNGSDKRQEMFEDVVKLIKEQKLEQWIEPFPFEKFPEALSRASEGNRIGKVLLKF